MIGGIFFFQKGKHTQLDTDGDLDEFIDERESVPVKRADVISGHIS